MTNFITLDQEKKVPAVLRVVGVGGAGCNAINSMIDRGLTGVEFIAVNTDIQDLEKVKATVKLQIGSNLTRGLGAGANSEVGKKAAEEDRDKISDVLRDSDMVFITAGMGGGTGTGAAPVVASIAKNLGALVVGVVTLPFRFEGRQKQLIAEKGVQELRQHVDSLIMIPNEKLMAILDKKISMQQAFDKPNEVLFEATRGIADLITETGLFNVDFADVKTVMAGSGMALMGCGIASGENRAKEAARRAITNPWSEGLSIRGAKKVLINITGSSAVAIDEVYEGNNLITEQIGEEALVIFGVVVKPEMNEYLSYTVLATGFNDAKAEDLSDASTMQHKVPVTPKSAPGRQTARPSAMPSIFDLPGNSITDIDLDDVDTPAFLRVKAKQEMDERARAGEKDIFDSNSDGEIRKKTFLQQRDELNENRRNEQSSSSSFLNLMMD